MEIIHQEKKEMACIGALKPTDVAYINDQLYMYIRRISTTDKVEVLQLVTGVCEYISDRTDCEPVEAALMVRE